MAEDIIKTNIEGDGGKKEEPKVTPASTFTEGKFKSHEEAEKAYGDLEKKLGEMGEELGKSREFAQVVQPLLETVRNDPELFALIDKKLQGKANDTPSEKKEAIDDVRDSTANMLIERFEEKYGITRLDPDKKKVMREKIGDTIQEMTGQTAKTLDLRRLPDTLERAYFLANKDALIEKSKLEALVSAKGNSEGSIPSISSTPGKTEKTLSPEEHKVAGKMGLTDEEYLTSKEKSSR